MVVKQGDEQGVRSTVVPCQEPLPGHRTMALPGVQAEGGWRSCGGGLASPADGHRVWDESGPGAEEEGSGLTSSQELVDGARV